MPLALANAAPPPVVPLPLVPHPAPSLSELPPRELPALQQIPPHPRLESFDSLSSLPSPITKADSTRGSLAVEIGDGSQMSTPVSDTHLEGTLDYATGRGEESSHTDVADAAGSTLNTGFRAENQSKAAPDNVAEEHSPPPGYVTAASGSDRIRHHPIFDLQFSTPANHDNTPNLNEDPNAPSGEVAPTTSGESTASTGEVAASGTAKSSGASGDTLGTIGVANAPVPSSSTANEVAFESGPPGETYSRLPINRLGHQPNAEEHLYHGGPLYQQMAAALQSPQRDLNQKAKSRKGAKAMEPKFHPYNFRSNARGKTYDEDTESD